MALQVSNGATLQCTFGMAPSSLTVLPANKVMTSNLPAATIMDKAPVVNIAPFGMCQCMGNPTVASATAAAQGVLTPMPCMPAIPGPWAPGCATVMIGNYPALDNSSKLLCAYGGVISIVSPGQTMVQIP
jgi:hypothetical protein